MPTPESLVKAELKKLLPTIGVYSLKDAVARREAGEGIEGYYFMAAATGMGEAGIADFVMCVMGQYIEVEVKSAKGKPTSLQRLHGEIINNAEGEWYLVKGIDEVQPFINFLSSQIDIYIKAENTAKTMAAEMQKRLTGGVLH